jgi:hypothetical protein
MSRTIQSEIRQEIIEALRKDLIGPRAGIDEVLDENPELSYLTGTLHSTDKESEIEFDDQEDLSLDSGDADALGEEDNEDRYSTKFKQQSSLGISFYLKEETNEVLIDLKWGDYFAEKKMVEDKDGKEKSVRIYQRFPRESTLRLKFNKNKSNDYNLADFDDSVDKIFFDKVLVKTTQFPLKNGYKLVSVNISNHRIPNSEMVNSIMFQVEMSIILDKDNFFIPENLCRKIELDDEYLYESKPIFSHGHGCATNWNLIEDKCQLIYTQFIPEHELPSVSPTLESISPDYFSMKFIMNPKNKDETINRLKTLQGLYNEWIDKLNNSEKANLPGFKSKAIDVLSLCRVQSERMLKGIEILETNPAALEAFYFMNQCMFLQRAITAFSKKHGNNIQCSLSEEIDKDNSHWRAFQIAFILVNIDSITDYNSNYRKYVDLLYFPTGGGKTEAYLGLMAFLMGYRRLTNNIEGYNKDGGVTVILRYTLRLLTTQQRDRLTKMVIAAEFIRQKYLDKGSTKFGKEPYSVGFYVGGGVTPNRYDEFKDTNDSPDKQASSKNKLIKQLISCPYCGKPLSTESVYLDDAKETIDIYCEDSNCVFFKYASTPKAIPVYLVDEQIYRKCPTVVIATVDKFARLPWDPACNSLFGRVDRFCPNHGYLAAGQKHSGSHHGKQKVSVHGIKPFFPPELIVQDELHLITGPLGTIYGAYEAAIEELCTIELNGNTILPKYIVSTATIRNADKQIKALYGRKDTAQFPANGLDVKDSYFTKEVPTDISPFRKYVGICASGKSMKTTELRVYAILIQKVLELRENPKYTEYTDPYYTLIGYFNSIRELGGTVRLLQDDIQKRIKWIKKHYNHPKERFFKFREITSRMRTDQIAGLLKELEVTIEEKEKGNKDFIDVAIATNMISVGLDIDRLGLMCVFGQPKQSSEYIQTTSRIGRTYPGLVVTIYNPYRPRDLSHYENFKGYHSQIYRFVEGTTATPFSARARDRVLHALFIALARLTISGLADNEAANDISNANSTEIDAIINKIAKRVAKVSPKLQSDVVTELRQFVDDWKMLQKVSTNKLFYFITDTTNNSRLMNYYGEVSTNKEKPTLNSMREVETASTLFYYEVN